MRKDKGGDFTMIKGTVLQADMKILNIHRSTPFHKTNTIRCNVTD